MGHSLIYMYMPAVNMSVYGIGPSLPLVTAERNRSESVTQQCEQLQQQLSEAHTQVS